MNSNIPIYVLRELMSHPNKEFNTKELSLAVGCERKAVYYAMAVLECAGFPIEVEKKSMGKEKTNTYRWTGQVFGGDV